MPTFLTPVEIQRKIQNITYKTNVSIRVRVRICVLVRWLNCEIIYFSQIFYDRDLYKGFVESRDGSSG